MPKNAGSAPWSRMNSSANLSKYNVVTPGLISFAIIPKVLETISALSRINSISSAFFIIIIFLKLSLQKYNILLIIFIFMKKYEFCHFLGLIWLVILRKNQV